MSLASWHNKALLSNNFSAALQDCRRARRYFYRYTMIRAYILAFSICVMPTSALAEEFYYTEHVEVPSVSDFESIAHYSFLHYGVSEIAEIGVCFVSPTKSHALCEHNESGEIRLFSPSNKTGSALWKVSEAYLDEVEWHENENLVFLAKVVNGAEYQYVQINLETLVETER